MTDPKKDNDPEVVPINDDDSDLYIRRLRKKNTAKFVKKDGKPQVGKKVTRKNQSDSVKDSYSLRNNPLAFLTNNNKRQKTNEKVSLLSSFLLSTKLLEDNFLETRIEFQRNAYDDADELWLVTWKFNIIDEQMRVRLMKDELERFVYPIFLTLKHLEIHTYEECIEIRLGVKHHIFP